MRLIDTHNDNWLVVRDWARSRLDELLGTPDNPGVLERPTIEWEKTVAYRAEIRVLRKLLGLPEELKHGRANAEPRA